MITLSRPLHAELYYRVMSHLDLGRDAASLFDPRRPERGWTRGLLEAYQAAPGRLVTQVLPLLTPDLRALLNGLRSYGFAQLRDAAGRELCDRLVGALEVELPLVDRAAHAAGDERARGALRRLEPLLARLRRALHGAAKPPLLIVDCDSLATGQGTHGRSLSSRDRSIVAVSLAPPGDQVLCQILHEAIHLVTDGPIRERLRHLTQDTRHGSDGLELHRQLEREAVQRGQQLIDEEAPELTVAYSDWRRRHGV